MVPIRWQAGKGVETVHRRRRQLVCNHAQRLAKIHTEFEHEAVVELRSQVVQSEMEQAVRTAGRGRGARTARGTREDEACAKTRWICGGAHYKWFVHASSRWRPSERRRSPRSDLDPARGGGTAPLRPQGPESRRRRRSRTVSWCGQRERPTLLWRHTPRGRAQALPCAVLGHRAAATHGFRQTMARASLRSASWNVCRAEKWSGSAHQHVGQVRLPAPVLGGQALIEVLCLVQTPDILPHHSQEEAALGMLELVDRCARDRVLHFPDRFHHLALRM
eukprot:3450421-Prymnesium_polylepis.1